MEKGEAIGHGKEGTLKPGMIWAVAIGLLTLFEALSMHLGGYKPPLPGRSLRHLHALGFAVGDVVDLGVAAAEVEGQGVLAASDGRGGGGVVALMWVKGEDEPFVVANAEFAHERALLFPEERGGFVDDELGFAEGL